MMKSHQPPSLWLAPGIYESTFTSYRFVDSFCKINKVTLEELSSDARHTEVRQPRQMLMRLLKLNFYKLSLKEVGNMFNRNHATVLHAIKTVQNLYDTDRDFRAFYNSMINQIERDNYLQQPLIR